MNTSTFGNKLFLLISLFCFSLSGCQDGSSSESTHSKGIQILMVGGGSSHDYDRWFKQEDAATLEQDGLAIVHYTDNPDSIGHYLPDIDVLLLSNNQPINDQAIREAIFDFVAKGNGLVLTHAALWYNWNDWPEYNKQLVGGGSKGHDPYGNFVVTVTEPDHPVTRDLPENFKLDDELYYFIPDSEGPGIEVLASARKEGSDTSFPSVFVVKHNKGRIVGVAIGHDEASHTLPAYQQLLRNSVKWAADK
ncbi:MAG: ThuA domain-containing protein [Bacteroidota bacterium]|jgi:type 1 glutamine amidotransferase|nr:ThuA domain-containing protein [Bacteroidota bacterium]